ncbi:MAG: DUF1178 family protein [Betaproteobacteria bacterium]|nr:DUF1178 family protein [Betaproteobacteria bacterium]
MIVFDLLCGDGHRFEGWFGSAGDFSEQQKNHLLNCPVCGIEHVERVPSAARLNLGAVEPEPKKSEPAPNQAGSMEGKDPFAIAQMLYSQMLDQLISNTEDVGKHFPAEARRIHYQEAPARGIRGQATQEEHEALLDEGIAVARLPVPSSRTWN